MISTASVRSQRLDAAADAVDSEPTEEENEDHEMVDFGFGGYTKCTTCNMHGPSPESGSTFCVNCRLCLTCIGKPLPAPNTCLRVHKLPL